MTDHLRKSVPERATQAEQKATIRPMPNTLDGRPASSSADPSADMEVKAAGRIVKKAVHAGGIPGHGGVQLDSLGRRWNSSLHPRDANGRFIETGGIASIPALGVRGKVLRTTGNNRVELRLANGEKKVYPGSQIRMVARPDGSKPIDAPDPKDATAFEKAITKLNDEDEKRLNDPKRGDGVNTPDEGDWDNDGILNEKDETPLGEKKPAKGKKRKGGEDAGHGYTLHSKPEGGESADVNHTLEDPEGNVIGTATSGIPSRSGQTAAWRGQVGGEKVDGRNKDGWVLAAKRAHVHQKRRGAGSGPAADKPRTAPVARKPKSIVTDAHREERAELGEPGRVAYDLARHDGKNHITAMQEGHTADRTRRSTNAPAAADPNSPEGRDHDARNNALRVWDKDAKAYGEDEARKRHGDREEYAAKQVERDRASREEKPARDEKPLSAMTDVALDFRRGTTDDEDEKKRVNAELDRRAKERAAKKADEGTLFGGPDEGDDNERSRTGRPETDVAKDEQRAAAAEERAAKAEERAAAAEKRAADAVKPDRDTPVRDNGTTTPKGETREQVRNDRGEVLDDVPAEPRGSERGPDSPVREPGRAGAVADRRAVAGRDGDGEGGEPGRDVPGAAEPAAERADNARVGRPARRGDAATGAGDRGQEDARDSAGRLGAVEKTAPSKPAPRFRPQGQGDLAPEGPEAKLAANMAALRTLRDLKAEGRTATPEEQHVLARWAGWGALPKVFDEDDSRYAAERDELKDLLGDRGYAAARRNTLNAHYTDAAVVEQAWKALEELGFERGDVLEPGSGSGNFIGHAPGGARMTGVELDPTTAAISANLYPDAEIHNEGFQHSPFRNNSFDAVIGNVPFSSAKLRDPEHNPGRKESMHNHFINRSLDHLKPGGVMAVVTSQWTLDSQDDSHRQRMFDKADLLGAVRLPSGTHRSAADTDVVTDMLIFRKRKEGEPKGDDSWLKAVEAHDASGRPIIGANGDPQTINQHYADHPEDMLGRLESGGYNGHNLIPEGNTNERLAARLKAITSKAVSQGKGFDAEPGDGKPKRVNKDAMDGTISLSGHDKDGTPTFTIMEDGVPVEHVPNGPKQAEELASILDLREKANRLLELEADPDASNDEIEDLRAALNRAYDDYVKKHGPLGRYTIATKPDKDGEFRKTPAQQGWFRRDFTSADVYALEKSYEAPSKEFPKGRAEKSDLFKRRQLHPATERVERADTPTDAVALLEERGHNITWESMADLMDIPEDEARKLGADAVFVDHKNPDRLVGRADYLSDNVRVKLAEVEDMLADDPTNADLLRNAAALREVVPPDAAPDEVPLQLGAVWMPKEVIGAFAADLMRFPSYERDAIKVSQDAKGIWNVPTPPVSKRRGKESLEREVWGTPDLSFYQLLTSVMRQNHRTIKINRKDGEGNSYLDTEATAAARDKAVEIAAEWEKWVFDHADAMDSLSKAYSEKFRARIPRSYVGSPKREYEGMNPDISLRPHQNDAATRMVHEESVLLEHVVGSGKTYTIAAGLMELKRLGMARKPVLVVPNSLLDQAVREFKHLYPNAKVLAGDTDAVSPTNRRKFGALARNNEWDVVLMSRTAFEAVPVSKEYHGDYIAKEIARLREALASAQHDDMEEGTAATKKTVKQIEDLILKEETKLEDQLDNRKDDGGITFESMGFDYIASDEAHAYKNLNFLSRIDGISSPAGADRARDMHMKLELLRDNAGENARVATFATGTPVSNSLAEMYTVTRMLRPDLLEEANIDQFDSWAATLARVSSKMELNTAGDGYEQRIRMRGFTDGLGDGMRIWRTFADTKVFEDLPYLSRPKIKGGGRQIHVVPMSEAQQEVKLSLRDRVNNLPKGFKPKKGDDNHLAIIGDGRVNAIAPGLMSERGLNSAGIDPDSPEAMDSPKIEKMADGIADIWARMKGNTYKIDHESDVDAPEKGALQMVMGDSSRGGYTLLKNALVARGMDPKRIRFAQDEPNKDKLYEDARQGRVDVLFGSTESLGTGVNVQNRLYALHQMDASWKPSDIEQREGRIWRQGNQHGEIEIHVYATENTHDVKTWDMIAYKQAGLDQLRSADYNQRALDFADDEDPMKNFDAIAGDASGNPLIGERRDLEAQLAGIRKSAARHAQGIELAGKRSEQAKMFAQAHRDRAAVLRKAQESWKDTRGDLFSATIGGPRGSEFTDRKAVGDSIEKTVKDALEDRYMPKGAQNARRIPGKDVTIGGLTAQLYVYRSHNDNKRYAEYRFARPDQHPYEDPNLPVDPVIVSRDEVKGSSILTRLENRVNSLDAAALKQESMAELKDDEARDLVQAMARDFNGAQELIDGDRQMTLLNQLLGDGGKPEERAAWRAEYDQLKGAGAERTKAERAAKAAASAARRDAKNKPAEVVPGALTEEEKAEKARRLREDLDAARAKKAERDAAVRKAAGLDDKKPAATPEAAPAAPETVTVPRDELAADAEELGIDLPDATPEAPKADAPSEPAGVDRSTSQPRITDPSVVQHETTLRSPGVKSDLMTSLDGESDKGFTIEGNKMRVYDVDKALDTVRNWTEPNGIYDGQDPEDHKHRPAMERLEKELVKVKADRDASAPKQTDARTPDEDGLVESVNEGELPGQTRLGGDDMQSQITEDFMRTEEAPAPKPAPEPERPAQDGPDLFAEPETDTPDVPEAPADERRADGTPDAPPTPEADAATGGTRAAVLDGMAPGDHAWLDGKLRKMSEGDSNKDVQAAARAWVNGEDLTPEQTRLLASVFETAAVIDARQGNTNSARFARRAGKALREHQGEQSTPEADAPAEAAPEAPNVDAPEANAPEAPQADAPEVDEPQSPDELPDTAEDLNLVPDPEPIEHPAAAERLPGEKFDPTPQQQKVYDNALDGKDVVIQAKAGAGKTSTLEGLARRLEVTEPDAKVAYIAFNKSVQTEAQGRMPKNVEPRTGHSVAFAWASDDLKERFDRRGLRRPDEIARHLGINEDMKVPGEKALSPKEQAMAVVRAIDTFANSADDQITAAHLPDRMHGLPTAEQDALVAYARKGWDDLLDAKGGQLNLTLDHMRKMWALSKPDFTKAGSGLKRRANVLFLDEAQDTPPVLAKVIADQKMRKVIVGDADQAIYGFTGATDYLTTAKADVELPLTKSFRFGPQVADWGNRFLQLLGSKGRVEGAGPDSKIVNGMKDADAILVRSNGGMIGELMRELEAGRTVGVPKGTKKDLLSLVETARYLKGEGPMPERLHDDLAPFRTWDEVVQEAAKGDDAKIKMLARIVGEHGVDKLDEIVQQVTELGDSGLDGVEFENMPHGLVARGKTFGIKDDLKAAGFRWTEVPGEKIDGGKNAGQPLKAWTAGGDEATREARLAKLREAKAGPTPDVVVSTAHKSKGLEWDRVKIGDDFQGPKQDPATGKTIMPSADENRLAYVAVTRAQKELDPGSLSWVQDYTDANGGTPGKVKVPADAVRPEDRPTVDAPKADAPEAETGTPGAMSPGDRTALTQGLSAETELSKRGVKFSFAREEAEGQEYRDKYERAKEAVRAELFDGGPEADLSEIMATPEAPAADAPETERSPLLSWPPKGETPQVKVAPGQPGEGQHWLHDDSVVVFTDANTGKQVVGQVRDQEHFNAKGKKVRGDEKTAMKRLTMVDGRKVMMEGDAKPALFHPNAAILNAVHHRPERLSGARTHMLERDAENIEKGLTVLRGLTPEQVTAVDQAMADGTIRTPYEMKDPTTAKLVAHMEHVLGLYNDEIAKRDDRGVEKAEIEAAQAADAARNAGRAADDLDADVSGADEPVDALLEEPSNPVVAPSADGRDYATMSDEDLMDAVADAANRDDMDAFTAILAEQKMRDDHAQKWGTPWVPTEPTEDAADAAPKTKKQQEKEWQDELHDANGAILLQFYRKSGHPYAENATGDGSEMLEGLDASGRTALLNGRKISRKRLAKMSEESTTALWGMTPAEMKADPKDHSTLGIPGAIDRDDWMEDKRRGGDGFGSSLNNEDEDRLRFGDPEDLHDDELEDGINRSRASNDDDRHEELLAEKVDRAAQDDEERKRREAERDQRREQDERDAKDVPEGDVRDFTDEELADSIREDNEKRSRHARGEQYRREQLSDDEREQEEEERKRRRHRRNRRRRRRNRHGGHGGNGMPHPRMPHLDMPHLPHDKDESDRTPGDKDAVEKQLANRDAHTPDVDKAAADLGMDTTKTGDQLTPAEAAKDAAAIDNAYGDPATDMDAFVAVEDLPEGGVPGSGTVGGATRDEIDPATANERLFNTAMNALGEPGDRKVTDADTLRDELGAKYGDRLLDGKGIPARDAGSMLGEADTTALFGKTPDELTDMGDTKVRWAGAAPAERVLAPYAKDATGKPSADAPAALPSRADAIANPDERGWSQPMSPADLQVGDVILAENRHGAAEVVTGVEPTTLRGEPGAVISTEGGNKGFIGESSPVRVNAERAVAGKKGKVRKADLEKMTDAAKEAMTEERQAERDAAKDAGLLPETDADGYYPAEGDPAEIPVGQYGLSDGDMEALLHGKLTDAPVFVTGLKKDGTPFIGEPVRFQRGRGAQPDGTLTFEGPDGEVDVKGSEVASLRLVSGEVAMPGGPVLATRLRPGSRAVTQNMGRPSWSQGVGKKVEIDPDGSIHMASGNEQTPGARSTLGTPDAPRMMHPLVRHMAPAAAPEAAPEPDTTPEVAKAPDVTPEVDAPSAPEAAEAPAEPDRAAAPEVEAPNAGEAPVAPSNDPGDRGASTLPRKPQEPAPVEQDATPAPAEDTEQAPAVVRPMDTVDDLPTALEPITGRKPDWVTPDALQIGDYAWVDGMDDRGNPLRTAGYLANDPQPAEFQPANGGKPSDVLGVLLSDDIDGAGTQTMVWVPLDRLAALAPRPDADDVVPEGEQFATNKLDVANGRMPNRIPTDSKGKLGLFPRTLVKDVDGQREGIVIASRGEDVSVRWGGGEVEDVNGQSLTITDRGIQLPDGWRANGRRLPQASDPAKQKPIDVANAVQDELLSVARADTDDLVAKLGAALDGSKPMSKAEFERTLQGIVRKHMQESQARRVQAARRMVAQRPYEAGLLTKVIAALGLLTLAIAAALIAALTWLFNENNRQWAKEHLGLAQRQVSRKVRKLPEFDRLHRLLGVTDDADAGGVDELVDAMGGAR